jgi:hypothetical protein
VDNLQCDVAEPATAESEYAEYVRDRDAYLAKAIPAWRARTAADPNDKVRYVVGRCGGDMKIVTANDRDHEQAARERDWEEWEEQALRERDRLDHANTPLALAASRPLATGSAPASRPRGRRTRRVSGPSARGSGRRSDDPEPGAAPLTRRLPAPLSRGAR